MEFIDTNKITSDTDKLDAILRMIENVLEEVVQSRILFSHNLRAGLVDSWDEIRPNIERMRGQLREEPDGLKEVGLQGPNLDLKYQGIFDSYRRLNRRGGTGRLKKFIRWAKIVVGSLATMVPVLKELAEILNEYMEGIEMGIEDAEDS